MSIRRRWQSAQQSGNAVLFSLIIMGSALTASLGLATLVTGEVRTVALIPPSERAYYKAESFVEQGLWQKKIDPDFQRKTAADVVPNATASFVCASQPCFNATPSAEFGVLKDFVATTSPPEDEVALSQEVTIQLDVSTATTGPANATLTLGTIPNDTGLLGVELTVVATPKTVSGTSPRFSGGSSQNTPVFVDKRIYQPGQVATIANMGPGIVNQLNEGYPPLNTHNYRLRIKSLGANTTVEPNVTDSGGTELTLRSSDFTVQAVAEDGPARRGIRVVTPASSQIASVFDYVLFSDDDLDKTSAKAPAVSTDASILNQVLYKPFDGNNGCNAAGQTPWPNIEVRVNGQPSQRTDALGQALFAGLTPSTNYYSTVVVPSGGSWFLCNGLSSPHPGGNPNPAAPGAPLNIAERRTNTFVFRPQCTQVDQGSWHWHDTSYWHLHDEWAGPYWDNPSGGHWHDEWSPADHWVYLGQDPYPTSGYVDYWHFHEWSGITTRANSNPPRRWYNVWLYYHFVYYHYHSQGEWHYHTNNVWVCPNP